MCEEKIVNGHKIRVIDDLYITQNLPYRWVWSAEEDSISDELEQSLIQAWGKPTRVVHVSESGRPACLEWS